MTAEPPRPPRVRALRRALIGIVGLLGLLVVVTFVARQGSSSVLPPVQVASAAVEGTTVVRYPLKSRAADRRLVQTVILPRGELRGRPLLVFLHGKGQDPAWIAGAPMRAAVARLGNRAPVVLLPADDGGSYWHNRRSGRWEDYVLDEAIPTVVKRFGLDGTRRAIGGISMGGAGAFAIAQHDPGGFCAVGGHSPALWPSAGATAPGAYDGAADFRRNDPVAPILAGRIRYGVPVWLDAGRTDPFRPTIQRFGAALGRNRERVTVRSGPGGHEGRYWQRHMASYMAFYARALSGSDCGERTETASLSR